MALKRLPFFRRRAYHAGYRDGSAFPDVERTPPRFYADDYEYGYSLARAVRMPPIPSDNLDEWSAWLMHAEQRRYALRAWHSRYFPEAVAAMEADGRLTPLA